MKTDTIYWLLGLGGVAAAVGAYFYVSSKKTDEDSDVEGSGWSLADSLGGWGAKAPAKPAAKTTKQTGLSSGGKGEIVLEGGEGVSGAKGVETYGWTRAGYMRMR